MVGPWGNSAGQPRYDPWLYSLAHGLIFCFNISHLQRTLVNLLLFKHLKSELEVQISSWRNNFLPILVRQIWYFIDKNLGA